MEDKTKDIVYNITFQRKIKDNLVIASCSNPKISCYPIDIAENGGIDHLSELISPENVIIIIYRLLLIMMNFYFMKYGLLLPRETSNLKTNTNKKPSTIYSIFIKTVSKESLFASIIMCTIRIGLWIWNFNAKVWIFVKRLLKI